MHPKSIEVIIPMSMRPDDEVPLTELERRLGFMKEFNFWDVDNDCRRFADTMTLWREKELYKHFSESWELFVDEHVQKPIEWVNHIIQGTTLLDSNGAISAKDAIAAVRKLTTQQLAADPKDLNIAPGNPTGANQFTKDEERNLDYYQDSKQEPASAQGGSDPEYLTARIARDRPDILDKMRQGEYPSVRAAAVDAGIVKPRKQFTVGSSTTPEAFAGSLWEKLDEEFLVQVVAILNDALGDQG